MSEESEEINAAPSNTGRLTWVAGNRPVDELDETSQKILAAGEGMNGTSIFDPVLCELAYRWYCPPGGAILDCFAGGSVRGIVAGALGYRYTGVDLRAEQVAANREQGIDVFKRLQGIKRETLAVMPEWRCGDSQDIAAVAPGEYDFLFSCPPYADLEVYSEDARDLSAIAASNYEAFRLAYSGIIKASVGSLKPDSFACFVIGEVRRADGSYYNFVGDTVRAFIEAGCSYYNECILVTALGSLPVRAGRQFQGGRKIGKTHQNVLVFLKGDWRKAVAKLGPDCQFGELPHEE